MDGPTPNLPSAPSALGNSHWTPTSRNNIQKDPKPHLKATAEKGKSSDSTSSTRPSTGVLASATWIFPS